MRVLSATNQVLWTSDLILPHSQTPLIDSILQSPIVEQPASGIFIPRLPVYKELLRVLKLSNPHMFMLDGFSGQGKTTTMNMFLHSIIDDPDSGQRIVPVACRLPLRNVKTQAALLLQVQTALGTYLHADFELDPGCCRG